MSNNLTINLRNVQASGKMLFLRLSRPGGLKSFCVRFADQHVCKNVQRI